MDHSQILCPTPANTPVCAYGSVCSTPRTPAVAPPLTNAPCPRRRKKATYSPPSRLVPSQLPYFMALLESYKNMGMDPAMLAEWEAFFMQYGAMYRGNEEDVGIYEDDAVPHAPRDASFADMLQNYIPRTTCWEEDSGMASWYPYPSEESIIWSSSPSSASTPPPAASTTSIPALPKQTASPLLARIAQKSFPSYRLGIYHRLLSPALSPDGIHSLFSVDPTHERVQSAEHAFMFVNTLVHPCAPPVPGAPGLAFSLVYRAEEAGEKQEDAEMVELMVRVQTEGDEWGMFRYFGRYELVSVDRPSMTVEEWHSLPPHCRDKWVQRARKNEEGPGAGQMHERIRKFERELARVGVLVVREELGSPPSAHAIRTAFDEGRENLTVLGMRCVGYTAAIARKIKEHAEARKCRAVE